MEAIINKIQSNYSKIKDNIARICGEIGVDPDSITIVAVTKTFPPEIVAEALQSGLKDIGENRVQEAETKQDTVRKYNGVFHLIGHLQSNKVKKAVQLFDIIQSVDSVKIARAISDECIKLNKTMNILLQINCSGEETKSGFAPDEIYEAMDIIKDLTGVRIMGLMTIGPLTADEELIRKDFQLTKLIFDELKRDHRDIDWKYLSMGMSGDYEIAVQEGANMLRIGSAIFGHRPV